MKPILILSGLLCALGGLAKAAAAQRPVRDDTRAYLKSVNAETAAAPVPVEKPATKEGKP